MQSMYGHRGSITKTVGVGFEASQRYSLAAFVSRYIAQVASMPDFWTPARQIASFSRLAWTRTRVGMEGFFMRNFLAKGAHCGGP